MCEKGWLRNLLEKTGWGNSRGTEKGNICWWWMEDGHEEIIDKWILATEGTFTLPTMNSLRWHTHTWQVKHHFKVGQIRPSSWGQVPLIPHLLDSVSFPCPIAPIDNLFSCCVHCQITASSWRCWDGKPYPCMNVQIHAHNLKKLRVNVTMWKIMLVKRVAQIQRHQFDFRRLQEEGKKKFFCFLNYKHRWTHMHIHWGRGDREGVGFPQIGMLNA